jgi:glycosyltransferase involved in cell wall biosynthesis
LTAVHDLADPRADAPLRIGIVGRLAPWKGHDVLFRAVAAAFEPGQAQVRVIGSALFGENACAAGLHRLVEQLGIARDVVWRGFQDDVAAELAELDVLVHASTVPEPFGSVIVEGMAAGLPVVAAAAGGPLEIVDHGRNGLLVPPGDPEALADGLRGLAADADLRRRLGAAGRESSALYSPAVARQRLLAVYAAICVAEGPTAIGVRRGREGPVNGADAGVASTRAIPVSHGPVGLVQPPVRS